MNAENRVSKRGFLKGMVVGGAVTAGTIALGIAEAEQVTPTDLGSRVIYFDQSAESIRFDKSGDIVVNTQLKAQEIQIIFAQDVEIAGERFTVDSKDDPGKAQVIAVMAANDISGLEYHVKPGVSVWKAKERSQATNRPDMLTDLTRAGEVQVSRSHIPGNCTPQGCTDTRLVTLVGHTDPDGVVRYDAVLDKNYPAGGN